MQKETTKIIFVDELFYDFPLTTNDWETPFEVIGEPPNQNTHFFGRPFTSNKQLFVDAMVKVRTRYPMEARIVVKKEDDTIISKIIAPVVNSVFDGVNDIASVFFGGYVEVDNGDFLTLQVKAREGDRILPTTHQTDNEVPVTFIRGWEI